jgi:hypothetical protein
MLTAFSIAAAAVMVLPAAASAQARRAVRVIRPVRSVVIVRPSPYYRPLFYGAPFYPYSSFYQPRYGYRIGYAGASLRVQATPREAEVFVDGYYAGRVDEFDGVLQRLRLEPGEHTIALYLDGYRSAQQQIYLQPGATFHLRERLAPLAPGDPAPMRPTPSANPQPAARGAVRLPPRRLPAPRSARADFGTLAVQVRPADATVTIDGEPWTTSPDAERLTVELAPGVHRLEIVKEGYRPYSADVTVGPGETETVNVALAR